MQNKTRTILLRLGCNMKKCGSTKDSCEAIIEPEKLRCRAYYHANKERMKANNKKWRENNKEKRQVYRKDWRKANKSHVQKYQKQYQKNNIEQIRERMAQWAKDNPVKIREYRTKVRLLHKDDLMWKLNKHVSTCMQRDLKRRGGKKDGTGWEKLVGYTLKELRIHLESMFVDGMGWDNRSDWHIDHIIPKSFFQYTTSSDVEFRMCWRLENLQPLWAEDNMSKGNKISQVA